MEYENGEGEPEVMANTNKPLPESTQAEVAPTDSAVVAGDVSKKLPYKAIAGIALVIAAVIAGVFLYTLKDSHVAVKQFTNVYSFVPEKISKSAPIQINVPDGVDEATAQASITFSPEVTGTWKTEELDGVVVFEPAKPLRPGVYYAVNLDTGEVQMSGDFYVDEDPQIEAIFPAADSESHEDTEITIVFNRPMVPLTTLSEQEKVELPITISPETPGTFKWISTRNLQFVPETTLIPSSDYTVVVDSGLYSLDGLPVAPVTHTFVTRPLRYEYVADRQIGYRSPMVVQFNQPVDIDKTEKQISVLNAAGKEVAIEVEYGETSYYDRQERKYITEPDSSKLFVYQKKDMHGRSKLWDFDTTYFLKLTGAVPLAGNKDLTEGKNTTVSVPNIVDHVSAQSDRSSLVRPDMFDPEGTLTITFYDEVDKDKSDINVKGLASIEYGERCKVDESGEVIQLGSGCEMEPDTKTLIFDFNASEFSTNESFAVELKKIYTQDGFLANAKPIYEEVRTYPTLQILSVQIDGGTNAAALNGMYVCTNAPLKDPGEDGLAAYVQTDGYIVYSRWSNSRYIKSANSRTHCADGQFETNLRYGLLPETSYSLRLAFTDAFSQTAQQDIAFRTQTPASQYTRFHNMQKQYIVTPPARTKLTYGVENLEFVDMHICRLEPETFLEQTVDRASRFTPPQSSGCTQVVQDRILLPDRYWVTNYFQVNLADYFTDTRGHYVITFSNPLYKDTYKNQQLYDRTYVSVTNLAVAKKEVMYADVTTTSSKNARTGNLLNKTVAAESNLYWVSNNQTLAPVAGAVVTQFASVRNVSFSRESSGYTDGQGVAKVLIEENIAGAVVRAGLDTAVVTDWADVLQRAGRTRDASRTYVYTDRPIYRPGHTVHIKGIDRIGFDGSYEVFTNQPVELEVFDAQGTSVYETTLTQSEYGTFATEFEIPADAALGTYRIEVFGQRYRFDVEEYVPAAFKLEASTNKEEYINGDTFTMDVQADYYFGVPLSEGTVSYSVTAQDYHFDRYTDEYFKFGSAWYSCYSCGYGDDFLFRGETTLNEDGKAFIKKELNLADYFDDIESEDSKLVTVSVTATDINGRSVSSQKSFVVHKSDFYLGLKTSKYYTNVTTPLELRVKTVDTNGEPMAVKGIERTLYKVSYETYKRQEVDGGFYYRSEKKLEEVSSEKISTDKDGNWSGSLQFDTEGQYEVQVSKTDDRGTVLRTVSRVYVFGSRSVKVPQNNNYELDLEVENLNPSVGDTASILIKSPYEKAKVLITAERGTVYDYWIADVTGGLYLHEFPIKSGYAPNVYVSAVLLSGDPEVKYGSARFEIGGEENKLDVTVTANKTHYLPGEDVTLSVQTKDHAGRPVSAEVSLAVADLSVLALKGNPKKSPALFFYDGFPLSVTTASNIKNILYEVDIPLGTKGGGGADPDDLATKKRGVFKDTAFWEASVVTSATGQATVSFTLPDNLTTWQVESLAVTKDTKLGVDYQEFTTKKDLMAVPLKPRFIVPGDTFSLGAKIFNQTNRGTTVSVQLESDTLVFTGEKSDSLFLNEGESKTVYFEVEAPRDIKAGSHQFMFTASDESFVDIVEQSISITANTTYETVATANFTKEDQAIEYLYVPAEVVSGEGGLTINANATMAVFMTDALKYMVTYPYGCSEQLASSLSTIGTLTSALRIPNVTGDFETIEYEGVEYTVNEVVTNGINQIYESQTLSGGFAYYKGMNENLYLTVHVVTALTKLQHAGYEVRSEVLQRALAYIESETKRVYRLSPDNDFNKEMVILSEYVLRLANGGKDTTLTPTVTRFIGDNSFLNENISTVSLGYLAILTAENFSRSNEKRVYEALQNRIDIDGRGAYLKSFSASNRNYFETPIKNTALLLKAFAAHNDEHSQMGNVLRWLLASRDQNGVWGGTHNTFVVIDGMIDYLEWQHETESHFSLRGILDGVEIFGYEFNPSNVFETFTHYIPMDELAREKLLPFIFERKNLGERENNMYYDIALKYFLPAASLPPRDEGITITRGLYALDDAHEDTELQKVAVGDVIQGKLTITIPDQYAHVAIEDIIPAGFEIVNFNLDTEDKSLLSTQKKDAAVAQGPDSWIERIKNALSGAQAAQVFRSRGFGGSYTNDTRTLRPTHIESHDDRVFLYVERLSPGVYEYSYFLRALVPGEFQHLPARAEQLFFPEVFGRTSGEMIEVTESQ